MRALSVPSVSLLAMLAAGCDQADRTLLGPEIDRLREGSSSVKSIPFRTSSYSFQVTAVAPEPGCDGTGESRVYLAGGGTATHLGRYTVALSFCSHPDGTLDAGQGTFRAANGDLLHFTFEGTSTFVPPVSLHFTSFATFSGGSGRFVAASGEATVTGTVDVSTEAGSGHWEGTISSVGSSKT